MILSRTYSHGSASDGAEDNPGLDRAGWAWEWLRRNPGYRAEAGAMLVESTDSSAVIRLDTANTARATRWGLHFRRASGRPCVFGASIMAR